MTETNRAIAALGESKLLQAGVADVHRVRDRTRRRRLLRAIVVISGLDVYLWSRYSNGRPIHPGLPHLPPDWVQFAPALVLIVLLGLVLVIPIVSSSAAHAYTARGDRKEDPARAS